MPDLGLASIHKWISRVLLAGKGPLVGPSPTNVPPRLPFRCGTMLLQVRPEMMETVTRGWQEEEDRFVAWVIANPAPRAEWLASVERLKSSQED